MIRLGCAVFGFVLLSPLIDGPGYGFDGLRLPVSLALGTVLLALLALGAVRGFPVAASSPWTFAAAGTLLAIHLASLAGAVSPGEGVSAVGVLAIGVAVLAFTRAGGLPAPFLYEGVPWLVLGLSAALSAVGIGQAVSGGEAVGLEGNRNYAGALIGMLLPFAVALACAGPVRRRLAAGGVGVLLFIALLLTASRGGLVGALVGTVLVSVVYLVRRSYRTAAVPSSAIGLLVLVPLVLQAGAHLGEGRADSVRVRLEIWKGAGTLLAGEPLLGVGPGNFSVRYPNHRSAREARLSHAHQDQGFTEVEDAHSTWVQTAVETGWPGLLALLGVAVLTGRRWVAAVRKGAEPADEAVVIGSGATVAAFLVAGLFNTLTLHVSHTVLFFMFVGLIERFAASARPASRSARVAVGALGVVGALVFSFWTWEASIRSGAERATLAVRGLPAAKQPALLERWADRSPGSWRVHYLLGNAYRRLGHFKEAGEMYRKALAVRPYQAAVLNDLAVSLLQAGYRKEAARWLDRADEVAPHCYLTPLNRGALAANEQRYEDALKAFAAALALKENHASIHYRIGRIHLIHGRTGEAVKPLTRARDLGFDVGGRLREDVPSVVGDVRLSEFFR